MVFGLGYGAARVARRRTAPVSAALHTPVWRATPRA